MKDLNFFLILGGILLAGIGAGALASKYENPHEGPVPVLNNYTSGGTRRAKSNRKKSIKKHKK
jgi:hypothetical protein